MSIFSKILSKIFPGNHPAVTTTASSQAAPAPGTGAAPANTAPSGAASAPSSATATSEPAPAVAPVDVEAVLAGLASKNPGPANWRTSIVDLMKLLNLDSSFEARKELAHELGFNGDTNDSASMNIWLHKQVMSKLAANGGKVPAELRD